MGQSCSAVEDAGVDTSLYSAHSACCSQSVTSKAYYNAILLDVLLRAAGWSSYNTFQKYYNKQLESDNISMTEAVFATN